MYKEIHYRIKRYLFYLHVSISLTMIVNIELMQRKSISSQSLIALFLRPFQVKQMQRHITALQLCQCLGCQVNSSKDDKIHLAKELVERHKQGIKFG